jgi:hypothetical protein
MIRPDQQHCIALIFSVLSSNGNMLIPRLQYKRRRKYSKRQALYIPDLVLDGDFLVEKNWNDVPHVIPLKILSSSTQDTFIGELKENESKPDFHCQ